jgi:CRISP-associated protein Cas1
MMSKAFRRDRDASGANSLLNYGYAVLRAATARAIVSAGLHPSLSVHHRSGGDALALADDLMEPFRPTVDLIVRRLCAEGITEIAGARGALVASLVADFPTSQGASPLSQVLVRLAQSLAQSCEKGRLRLVFPDRPIPVASDVHDDD